jgi:hypothetical protein
LADMESRTVEGLMAHCDWLKEKHYLGDSAVEGWKTAIKKVFEAVEGETFAQFDLSNLDLDEYLDRFQRAAGSAYKSETVAVYGRRIRNAIEAQLYYIEHRKPPAFRGGARTAENGEGKTKAKARPKATLADAPNSQRIPAGELIEFPFPLRTGQMARLHLPPQGLHPKDADRMSAFLRTLQYEEQKQLPERTGEDGVEVAA